MSGKRDLVVIGGGPAGLVVASVAAQLGLRVTLAEKSAHLGGDCLHTGCVPSKTLIHAAGIVHSTRQGVASGLLDAMPAVDYGRVIDEVQRVIAHIQQHDDPERFRGYGCEVLFGAATFTSPHEVRIGDKLRKGRRFVIASGSVPAIPPIPLLEQTGFDTSDTIFTRRALPGHLAVIGGGPIGVELSQAFARLGSRVTLIEAAGRLLANEDPAVGECLQAQLQGEGIEVRLKAQVAGVRRAGDHRQIALADGSTVECERILIATGRRPVVHGLGLEEAGVAFDRRGIQVDRRLRTSQKHIYAAGDVCGPYALTHMAEYQAGVVLANAVFRTPKKVDYRVVPRVVYTDPEVAAVGLTEAAARQAGIKYDVAEFPMADIDRAITDGREAGQARLLLRKGRLLGASLVGAHAGELIHELALAMQVKAPARQITATIHAYPTYAQIHRRTVNAHYAQLLRSRKTRLLVRLLNRLLP